MSFEFQEPHAATLTSVTPRTEKHGEDDVFAISLGLKITGANTLLDKLSPTLRTALYKPADESQADLPAVEQSTPLPRVTGIELMTLKGTLQGWTICIEHGIDEAAPITLGDAKIDHFRVSPHYDGTVDLMFRVGSNDVDATEAGLLCSHLRQEIKFTLRAPEIKADPPVIDGSVGHPALAAEGSGDVPSAGDLFAAGSEPQTTGPFDEGGTAGAGPDDADDPDDRGDDTEGGAPDADAGEAEQREIEAGMATAISRAGVKQRRGGRGARA